MYYYKTKHGGLVKFKKPVAKLTQNILGFHNISKLNYQNSLTIKDNHEKRLTKLMKGK
jgi:hypothetical protein